MKEYHVLVLSDGTIKTEEINLTNIDDLLSKSSSRIKQTILVVREMKKIAAIRKENNRHLVYANMYNMAVTNIAKSLEIAKTSVRDKLERKLSLSALEIQDLLKNWIENGSDDLESKILDSTIGSQKEEQDQLVIKEFFRRYN